MKKLLSFILCSVMLISALIPLVSANTGTTEAKSGPLAITEIVPNPSSAGYEYIEVINTTDTAVDLRDYYIYRSLSDMRTAHNEWGDLSKLLSWGVNGNHVCKVSLSNISTSAVNLSKNQPVILWLKRNASDTVSGFVSFWQSETGMTVDSSKVYAVDVTNTSSFPLNALFGNDFLPEKSGGCSLALVNKSYAQSEATNKDAAQGAARLLAADSIVVNFERSNGLNANKAMNLYSYIDYDNFVEAHTNGYDYYGKGLFDTVVEEEKMYPALMAPRYDENGYVMLSTLANKSETSWSLDGASVGGTFIETSAVEAPTPGKLVDGQFGTKATNAHTGLAITEIISSTQGTTANENMYEFIEVTNTASTNITLSNYQVLLNGITCSGSYHGSMIYLTVDTTSDREFNAGQRSYATVQKNGSEDVVVAPGETAVIWFNNASTSGLSKSNFTSYWENLGNDMSGVTVAEASYVSGSTVSARGYGFMPDTQFAYSLYLIDTAKKSTDTTLSSYMTSFYSVETKLNKDTSTARAWRQKLTEAADSVAFIYQKNREVTNLSTNFYGYTNVDFYNYAAMLLKNYNALAGTSNKLVVTPMSANTVAKKGTPIDTYHSYGYGYGTANYGIINSNSNDDRIYLNTEMDSVPTPGKLVEGQFGYSAKSEGVKIEVLAYQISDKAETINDKACTDVRIVGWVDLTEEELANYSAIGMQISNAQAATDTTKGSATSSNSTNLKNGVLSNAVCTAQKTVTSTSVYTSIIGGENEYTLSDPMINKQSGYLFALTAEDIPVKNINLTFNCYLESANGKDSTGLYELTLKYELDAPEFNEEDEELLTTLKNELKTKMNANTQDYKVIFCDDTNKPTLAADEKAIWVDELFYAYPGSTAPAKKVIKAIYVYYPMHDDPSQLTLDQLTAKGATRVFAYMGIPESASEQSPVNGIVCTHGGGGHAHAKYCLEAVSHGYAAIAFDTEGYHATSGIDANTKDPLGHKEKDKFQTARQNITNQWLYYTISDCAFMNTVLRSLDAVDEDKVGITGISWGGMSVTVASCYDQRFAFCVPVYLSYFTGNQTNSGKFGDTAIYNYGFDKFAQALWHDAETLAASRVPTLFINSQKDTFASIASTTLAYQTLKENNPRTYMLIKTDLGHSQEKGATPSEIYRFGDWACSGFGIAKSFYTTDKTPDKALGRSYEIKVTAPNDLENVTATLYYTTAALSYKADYSSLQQTFTGVALTKTATTQNANGTTTYTFTVAVPDNAYLYYISFSAETDYDMAISTDYSSYDNFKGKILGTTDIVVLGNGGIEQ